MNRGVLSYDGGLKAHIHDRAAPACINHGRIEGRLVQQLVHLATRNGNPVRTRRSQGDIGGIQIQRFLAEEMCERLVVAVGIGIITLGGLLYLILSLPQGATTILQPVPGGTVVNPGLVIVPMDILGLLAVMNVIFSDLYRRYEE